MNLPQPPQSSLRCSQGPPREGYPSPSRQSMYYRPGPSTVFTLRTGVYTQRYMKFHTATSKVSISQSTYGFSGPYLDWPPVLALPPDGSQVPLKNLDVKPLLQQAHSQHQPSNSGSSNQDLWPLPRFLVSHGKELGILHGQAVLTACQHPCDHLRRMIKLGEAPSVHYNRSRLEKEGEDSTKVQPHPCALRAVRHTQEGFDMQIISPVRHWWRLQRRRTA